MVTFGGFLLLGGRAGDLLGRRRVMLGGLMLFVAASLASGLAQGASWSERGRCRAWRPRSWLR
jgi:MFS family permease